MRYKDGFQCDKQAKQRLKNLIENIWFSAYTITYDINNDNDDKARIDVIFTATSKSNKENHYKYAIELKERKKYNHNDFPDWMLEIDKYNILKLLEMESGFTSCYCNFFLDNVYALWTINKIDEETEISSVYAPKQTQGDETKIKKQYIKLIFDNATITGYTN